MFSLRYVLNKSDKIINDPVFLANSFGGNCRVNYLSALANETFIHGITVSFAGKNPVKLRHILFYIVGVGYFSPGQFCQFFAGIIENLTQAVIDLNPAFLTISEAI